MLPKKNCKYYTLSQKTRRKAEEKFSSMKHTTHSHVHSFSHSNKDFNEYTALPTDMQKDWHPLAPVLPYIDIPTPLPSERHTHIHHTPMHSLLHIHRLIHTHTHTHTQPHTHTHTHTTTHTHTHTHTHHSHKHHSHTTQTNTQEENWPAVQLLQTGGVRLSSSHVLRDHTPQPKAKNEIKLNSNNLQLCLSCSLFALFS